MVMARVRPFVLSGGSGTRLWPLSRRAYPKQFLRLFDNESLLQKTCRRLNNPSFDRVTFLANNDHRFLVAEQATEIGIEPEAIILEPMGRNTAPAAAIAALVAAQRDDSQLCLLLPSDHIIPDPDAVARAVKHGIDAANSGAIVTFGITPDSPHTGYG